MLPTLAAQVWRFFINMFVFSDRANPTLSITRFILADRIARPVFTGFLLTLLVLTLLPVGAGETERQVFNPQSCQGWDQAELATRVEVPSRGSVVDFSTGNSASFSARPGLTPDALNQSSNALGCSGWEIPLTGFAPSVDRAALTVSLGAAARPHSEDVVIVRTSLDGHNWTTRSSIVIDNQYSNERNGGYTLVPLDDITSLDALRQLRVEVIPALAEGSATRLFVDHVGLSADVITTAHAKTKRLDPATCVGWSNADQAKRINYRQNTPAEDFADRHVALIQRLADASPSVGNTDQSALTCETFGVLKATKGRMVIGASIVASLAARSGAPGTDAVVLEYSLDDGKTWQVGTTTVISGEDSNASRGGYLTVPITGGIDRASLAPLKVRVRYVAGEEPADAEVRVDGVGLDISTVPEPDQTASGLSFLARSSFLPLEEPVIVLEEGSLVGYEVTDSSGRPVDIQADAKISSRGVELTVRRGRQIRPGTYTVKLKSKQGRRIVEETQSFTWGVASINTPKSSYTLGEAMPVVLGVIDVNGRTVCDADLELDVESPSGDRRSFSSTAGTISASATCGPKSITDAPDYLVRIVAEEAGLYRMKLTVQTVDGPQSADLNVQATAVRPFSIERVAPSRINPKQNYKIRLFVESDQSQEINFVERVPESMSVSDVSDGGQTEQRNGEQVILWKFKLTAGREREVSYVVNPPDIAPALFTLGPAATDAVSEPRQWQIASDEIIERDGREFAYVSVQPDVHDWDRVQDNLIEPVKPIYRPDEIAVVKVWTDGFVDAAAPASVTQLSDVTLRGPDGAVVTLPSAIEVTNKSGLSRDVIYLAPLDGFRPGAYTVTATTGDGSSVSAPFEWGTLGVDFNRDDPKAKSLLQMNLVTRGPSGEISCDDALQLTIDRPDGDRRIFDSREGTLSICPNGQPTIEVEYGPSLVGSYNVELRRVRDGVERYVQQTFNASSRSETPRGVKSDMDQAVQADAASFGSKEQPRLRVKVIDTAAFGFLGVDSTSRTVTNFELIDPTGQRVAQSARRSRERQGRDTNELLDIDTSSFTKAGKYVALIDVEQGEYAETIEQDFTWGVLAVNVRRSFPHQNEDATVGIAVLDDTGITLCDANVTMTVADPKKKKKTFSTDKQSITRNPDCVDKGVTNDFDYQVVYRVAGPGTYTMSVTANTKNGVRTISDSFEVKPSVAFDVERTDFSMRIYPLADYDQQFTIVSNIPYRGIVQETVPASLVIKNISGHGTRTTSGADQIITWEVDWQSGGSNVLGYTIDFPDVSPEFYLLGPLVIGDPLAPGGAVFREARAWQVASDAACNATTTGNWSTGGNWTGCSGVGGLPASGDTVTIDSGVVITVDSGNPTVSALTIASAAGTNGLSVSTGQTLTVTNALTFAANAGTANQTVTMNGTGNITASSLSVNAPTSSGNSNITCAASANGTLTVTNAFGITGGSTAAQTGSVTADMLTCTLTAGSISITGGSVTAAELKASTGTLTSNAAWSFAGTAANAKVTTSGAATVNTAGDFNSGATVSFNSASTFVVNASSAIANYTYTNFNVASGTTTLNAGMTVSGTLTVGTDNVVSIASSQTLTHSGATLTLNGTISGAGRYTYQSATALPSIGTLSSILRMDATNNAQSITCASGGGRTLGGAVEFYSNTASSRSITICGTTSHVLNISGAVTVEAAGAGGLTVEANTYDPAINITGNFSGGTSGGGTETTSLGSGTWTVSGSVALTNGALSNYSNNTFVMNGASSNTLAGNNQIFYNLTIDPSTTATISLATSAVKVYGTLTIAAKGSFNLGAQTLDMDDVGTCSFVLNGTITSPAWTSTFNYGCTADFPSTGTTANYYTVIYASNGNTAVPGRAFTNSVSVLLLYSWTGSGVNRTITLGTAAGQTLSLNGYLRISTGNAGNLTVDASTNNPNVTVAQTFNMTKSSTGVPALISGSGTYTFTQGVDFTNGTVTSSTGNTWVMNGASRTLTTAGNALYNFTSSGTITMSGATSVTNDLIISAGTLTAPSATTLTIGHNFTNNSTFTHNSGTVVMTSTGGNINGTSDTTFSGLSISAGGDAIVTVGNTEDPTVAGTLLVDTSDTLAIDTSRTLKSTSTITLNGTISGAGTLEYQSSTAFPNSGTISSILRMNAVNNAQSVNCANGGGRTFGGAVEFYNGHASTARVITLCNSASEIANFSSTVSVNGAGGGALTLEVNTNDPTVNITGSLTTGTAGTGAETVSMGAGTWTVTGNVDFRNSTISNYTGGTLKMDGTGGKTIDGNAQTIYNYIVDPTSAATISLTGTGALSVSNDMTIATGDTLSLSSALAFGNQSTGAGTITLNGTISGTFLHYYSNTAFPTGGVMSAVIWMNCGASGSQTLSARDYGGIVQAICYAADTLTFAAGTFNFSSELRVAQNSNGVNYTIDAATNDPTVNITGDLNYNGNSGATGISIINAGANTWTVGGSVDFQDSTDLQNGQFNQESDGKLTMTAVGSNRTIESGGNTLNDFEVATGGNTVTLESPLTVSDDVTLTSGVLDVHTSEINGLTVGGDWTYVAGTFTERTGTVTFNGTTSSTLNSGCSDVTACTTQNFNDITINKTAGVGANDEVTLTTTGIRVTDDILITAGELVQGAFNVQVDTSGSVSVAASGIWTNIVTGDLFLGGTFDNAGSVTFNTNNNAQCTDVADDIVIDSTVDNTLRTWSGAGTYVMRNVNVDDMSDGAITITIYTSTKSGDTDWTTGTCGITVSGVLRNTDESTPHDCDSDPTSINVTVNGGTSTVIAETCSLDTGEFSLTTSNSPSSAGDPIVVYVDDGANVKGTTITLAADTTSSITGLDIYIDRVTVSHENAGPISNAKLATGDNGNAGIRYSVSGGNLTVESGMELHVLSGKTFTPGGAVTTTATGTAAGAAGDVHIAGTLTMETNNLIVGGDYNNAGTLNKTNTQTTTLAATGSGFTITPGTGDMNNLTVSGDAGGNGTYTLSGANLTVDGTLTVNTGDTLTIDTSRTLTNTGATDVNNDGTINGAGTLQFTSASGGPDSDANSTGTYTATTRYNTTGGNIAAATFDARTYSGRVEIYQDSTTASNRSITPATDGTYTLSGSSSHLYMMNDDAGQTLTLAGASASAVFTIGGDLDFTGAGGSSEIIQTGNDVWTVTGNFDTTGGTFTAATGNEVIMNGTANVIGNAQSFYKFTVNGNGNTVTMPSGTITVTNVLRVGAESDGNSDTFTITSGYVYSTSTGSVVFGENVTDTINGDGNLLVRNDAIDTDGVFGGTVMVTYDTYQGVAGLNAIARQYKYLTIDTYLAEAGETVTLGTSGGQTFTIDNDMNIACTACELGGFPNTIDGDAFDPIMDIGGSFLTTDTSAQGTYTISMGISTWTIGSGIDLTYAGTFNHNSGTVVMDGTGILISNAKTLNNFTTSGSGTITLANATHTFAGNIVLGASATLTPGTSTVVMNGTTKTIDGGGKTLYAFTVSGSTTTLQNTDLTVSNTLTISASQTLSINASRTLTHTGASLTWGNGSSTISGSGTLRFTDASGGPGTGGVVSAITRFDATSANIASTTIDARTYSGVVEIYSNSTSARTVTLDSVAYVLSGASSHLYIIAANTADLTVAGDTNNPTVTIGGDLDFTGTGEGFEVLAAGTGTWTVSGNVNFTNGFYGPSVAVIAPTLIDTVERNQYYDSFLGCALNTQYYCLGTAQYGMTEDTDTCIDSFQDRTENTDHMFMKFNPTGISDSVTILGANIGVHVQTVYTQTVLAGRSSTDDLTCGVPATTYTSTAGSQYGTASLGATGNSVIALGTTGAADVQSRITGSTARLTVSLNSSTFDSTMGSIASSAARPALYVGYYASGSPTLIMNGTGTLTSAGNALYNVTLSGTITLANATHTVSNNLDLTGGTVTPGTSTVLMTGPAATLTGSGTGSLYALTIDPPSAGTVTLATGGGDLTVSSALSVASGDTLSLGSSRTLTMSAATGINLTLSGTISGAGRLTYMSNASFPTGGTISSILRYDATSAASQSISSRTYGGAVEIYNNSGGAKTVASGSGTMAFSSTLSLSVGSGSVTLDLNTTDPTTTTVTGALTIGTNSTLSAPSTNAFNINDDYTNSGTFTDNGGTVTLAGTAVQQDLSGTLTGSSDFNNLVVANAYGDGSSTWSVTFAGNAATAGTFTAATANTKLRFNAGSTYTFVGINFNGQATGTRVYLRSSTPGSLWYINAGNDTVLNADVRDSDACASTGGAITPTDPTGTNYDAGNTFCWDINQISFSISDLNVGFGSCVPGAARFATGDSLGAAGDSADAHTLTLTTNARTGYALTVFGSTLSSTAGTITGLGGTATASSPGTEQFGLRAIINSGFGTVSSPFESSNWAFNASAVPQQIASHSGSASTTQIGVRYICNVSEITEASSYSTDLTYVLTATF